MIMDNVKRALDKLHQRLRIKQAYDNVFSTSEGQVVLHHILKEGFVVDSTFVAGDPHTTALNEGSRRLALSILRFAYKSDDRIIEEIKKLEQQKE